MKLSWDSAPLIIMEHVFKYLSFRDRYHASVACQQWYDAFYSPSLWSYLNIDGKMFTRQRKDKIMGLQQDVKHYFFESYLHCFGSRIKGIRFEPFDNYFNLYEFLSLISKYFDEFGPDAMPLLRHFEYDFYCTFDGTVTFGSGGRMLEILVETVSKLPKGVRKIELSDLFLSFLDASMLLTSVSGLKYSLVELNISNITKDTHTASYSSLLELTYLERVSVSLVNLSKSLISTLSRLPKLREVRAVEDEFSKIFILDLMEGQSQLSSADIWTPLVSTRCFTLEIHTGFTQPMLILPRQYPFKRLLYRSKLRLLTVEDLIDLQKIFHATLQDIYIEAPWTCFCKNYLPMQRYATVPLLLLNV